MKIVVFHTTSPTVLNQPVNIRTGPSVSRSEVIVIRGHYCLLGPSGEKGPD